MCLALEKDNKLFSVGSQSHVSFYDPRCGTAVGYIGSRDPGAGEYSGGVRRAEVSFWCCVSSECLIGRFSPKRRKVISFRYYATVYHGLAWFKPDNGTYNTQYSQQTSAKTATLKACGAKRRNKPIDPLEKHKLDQVDARNIRTSQDKCTAFSIGSKTMASEEERSRTNMISVIRIYLLSLQTVPISVGPGVNI